MCQCGHTRNDQEDATKARNSRSKAMASARPFMVTGDKTAHGGEVLKGSPTALINGKMIAPVGDNVRCSRSRCRGAHTIVEADPTVIVDGKAAVFHGAKTFCRAALIGSATQAVTTPEGQARGLTAGEIAMARLVFGDAIDYGKVKLHNGKYLWFGMQPDNVAMTPNGEMYFSPDYFSEDFSADDIDNRHWFIHEMTHVWQYQLGYPVKARGAIRLGLGYRYALSQEKQFGDYNMEAQGDLLADYFVLKHEHKPQAMHQQQYASQLSLFETVLQNFLINPGDTGNLP
jgi:uncharacterized Zn-binding protein involved in type VI secretion